jgi:hypothetical protein
MHNSGASAGFDPIGNSSAPINFKAQESCNDDAALNIAKGMHSASVEWPISGSNGATDLGLDGDLEIDLNSTWKWDAKGQA